jgi:hypothetical protein
MSAERFRLVVALSAVAIALAVWFQPHAEAVAPRATYQATPAPMQVEVEVVMPHRDCAGTSGLDGYYCKRGQ